MAGASRAIDIVKKVVAIASRGAPAQRGIVLGELALVKVLHVSTALARQLSHAPLPPMLPAQRATMELLAGQLRAIAGGMLASEASRDPSTVEGAMSAAVQETLRLVEIALGARQEELAPREEAIALGEGSRETES